MNMPQSTYVHMVAGAETDCGIDIVVGVSVSIHWHEVTCPVCRTSG